MIKPFGRRILVKPEPQKGVLQPDSLNEYGEVIAIGDEVKKIKVGDKIGFSIFGVEKLTIDENTPEEQKYYLILELDDFILATL